MCMASASRGMNWLDRWQERASGRKATATEWEMDRLSSGHEVSCIDACASQSRRAASLVAKKSAIGDLRFTSEQLRVARFRVLRSRASMVCALRIHVGTRDAAALHRLNSRWPGGGSSISRRRDILKSKRQEEGTAGPAPRAGARGLAWAHA